MVAAPVTIVGRREYRYHIAIVTPNEAIKRSAPVATDMSVRQNIMAYDRTLPVISFHDKLMSPRDQSQVVGVIESFGNVLAEGVASSTGGNPPATSVIWIGP